MRFVFLCFLIIPIVEMLVLIEVGSSIGATYTVLLVLATAIIGVSLLKRQGLSALLRANKKMQSGQMPVAEMGEGIMLAVAGALLLTPGFLTDTIGFLLLSPVVRNTLAHKWINALVTNGQNGFQYTEYRSVHTQSSEGESQESMDKGGGAGETLEGEYQEMTVEKDAPQNKTDL